MQGSVPIKSRVGVAGAAVVMLTGCIFQGLGPRTEEEVNTSTFQLVSSYYCARKGWPTSLQELEAFAEERKITSGVDFYGAPSLVSTRVPLLTLEYTPVADTASATAERKTISFVAPPTCSGAAVPPQEVAMVGDGVRFTVPDGFSVLDAGGMQERWGQGPFPDAAWASENGALLIALRFGEAEVTPGGLSDIKLALEEAYKQSTKGLKWIKRDRPSVGQTPWVLLAFESDSAKGRLFNVALSTSYGGRLFSLSVVGPKENRKDIQVVAEALARDITFEER